MAGFDYSQGKSNNALAAEAGGKITLGRWAKRYGVTAAAAKAVMNVYEYHHTGTGRRGKSRETYYIASTWQASPEQIAEMKAWDRTARLAKAGIGAIDHNDCVVRWIEWNGRYGRRWTANEQIERGRCVRVLADGVIEIGGFKGDARKLSGLVVAKEGKVIVESNVNPTYGSAAEIAERICKEAKHE